MLRRVKWFQTGGGAQALYRFDGLLYSLGASNQDANSSQSIIVRDVTDSKTRALLEQEVFKIDAYTNLVLQYLRLENFHDVVKHPKSR